MQMHPCIRGAFLGSSCALANGFRQIELGLSDAPPTMNGFEDTQRETGVRLASPVVGCLKPRSEKTPPPSLSSTTAEEREQALGCARRHIQVAQRLGAPI